MRFLAAVSVFVVLVACSSSNSANDCSCSVSIDGQSATIACGAQSCVAGQIQKCSAAADISTGDACSATDSGASSSSSSGSATTGGCTLIECTKSSDCGFAPCFSTSTGKSYCYEQEGNATLCTAGTTPTTKDTSNGSTTICVPSSCPQPDTFKP